MEKYKDLINTLIENKINHTTVFGWNETPEKDNDELAYIELTKENYKLLMEIASIKHNFYVLIDDTVKILVKGEK